MHENGKKRGRCRRGVLLLAVAAGAILTVLVSSATKATDQAQFCASCHSMSEAAWTHKQSVHAREDCNSCHLPHDLVSRMPMKAATGFHDVWVTWTGEIPPEIRATESMKQVINDNCIRCHSSTISTVNMTSKPYCTDCHRSVPHMSKTPVSQRRAADV